MKSLEEQNHYEVLEVGRSAEGLEIEQAYRILQGTYGSDSLALYSLFDEAAAGAVQKRIELAHRVLSDTDARRAYDAEIGGGEAGQGLSLRDEPDAVNGQDKPGGLADSPAKAQFNQPLDWAPHESVEPGVDTATGGASRGSAQLQRQPSGLASSISGFEDLEDDAEIGDEFDGARLRRARLRRGIELDEIASVTKISPAFLGAIEEESFDDLPARVYVRGFVIAYARAIGLDAQTVSKSYMARLDDSSGGRRRLRLLSRR